jgi:hypothetical protein|tara:strand:+ start:1168 stop:1410 length:243 start_codon:yes stop_codon:yes gene_type:complete
MEKKDVIPQEVIDYCIDNKVSIKEGMIAVIDARLEKAEQDVALLKNDVNNTINEQDSKVTKDEMDDVESFLNSLNQQIQD